MIKEFRKGDVFLVKERRQPLFVAVLPNKDFPDMWYLVAADYQDFIGTCDIEVRDETLPVDDKRAVSLMLRTAHGFWARPRDLDWDLRRDEVLAEYWVDYACEKLACAVSGELVHTEEYEMTDWSPEYMMHCDMLDRIISGLALGYKEDRDDG